MINYSYDSFAILPTPPSHEKMVIFYNSLIIKQSLILTKSEKEVAKWQNGKIKNFLTV